MELYVRYNSLPEGMDALRLRGELSGLLEDDGLLTGSGPGYVEINLLDEDDNRNPKYGILAVKYYLQNAGFAPDTAIELAGTPVGIYE